MLGVEKAYAAGDLLPLDLQEPSSQRLGTTYPADMTLAAPDAITTPPAVLTEALYVQAMAEVVVVAGTGGCLRHPTGRVKVFGGSFRVRHSLWEHEYGPLLPGRVLIRICGTIDCVAPTPAHQVATSRSEWGRVLGSRGGVWRPAS